MVGVASVIAIYRSDTFRERREFQRRSHQVKDMLFACHMYADRHGGRAPTKLEDLHEVYDSIGGGSAFLNRAIAELELVAPGATWMSQASDIVLLQEKHADAKGRKVFGYLDGHAELRMADGSPPRREVSEPLTP
jgi:hypothetical protein